MRTKNLILVPHTPDLLKAMLSSREAYEQLSPHKLAEGVRDFFVSAEVSPDYIARLQTSTSSDPWTHGFAVVLAVERLMIGACGYKGPPSAEGMVEIAYGIAPDYRGKGYATEIAETLAAYAFEQGRVKTVRAHTLPERNASGRVLTKCGFTLIGEVNDPGDGPVWRWEKSRQTSIP